MRCLVRCRRSEFSGRWCVVLDVHSVCRSDHDRVWRWRGVSGERALALLRRSANVAHTSKGGSRRGVATFVLHSKHSKAHLGGAHEYGMA